MTVFGGNWNGRETLVPGVILAHAATGVAVVPGATGVGVVVGVLTSTGVGVAAGVLTGVGGADVGAAMAMLR